MRVLPALLLATLVMLAPAASATGYLLNVGIGNSSLTYGANAFGGSGDTLDVGLFNRQCSDEADVVDVGVINQEGADGCDPRECYHNEGGDPLAPIGFAGPHQPTGSPTEARCSDDSDTVDVGVLNQEGAYTDWCDHEWCVQNDGGDAEDATDVGVGNNEWNDASDGNDAGVLNCETIDTNDSTDVGIVNREWIDDGDTFDVSVLSWQWTNNGDANGITLLPTKGPPLGCLVLHVETRI